MSMNYDETFNKVLDQLKEMVRTETVVGEPFSLGEFTCVPVIKVGVGFGSGGAIGKGKGNEKLDKGAGGGAGAGIGMTPIGFLVSRKDEISFLASDKKKGLDSIFEKVPDLLEKAMEMKKKKDPKK
ncbi:MAG: spore germination protein GerW family protein [Bacteroidales bacterium]